MEKRYIISAYEGVESILATLEDGYDLHRAPEDAGYTGDIFEVTIKKIGTVRQKIEVEFDSPQS